MYHSNKRKNVFLYEHCSRKERTFFQYDNRHNYLHSTINSHETVAKASEEVHDIIDSKFTHFGVNCLNMYDVSTRFYRYKFNTLRDRSLPYVDTVNFMDGVPHTEPCPVCGTPRENRFHLHRAVALKHEAKAAVKSMNRHLPGRQWGQFL